VPGDVTVNAVRRPGHPVGRVLAVYAIALALTLVFDALWLGVFAKGFYPQYIGHLLAADVRWGPAVLFYLAYVAGVVTFVVIPSRDAAPSRALARGAFFGFVAYATYDLTNQATMRDWPLLVTVVDLAWGTVLTATVSYLTRQWEGRRRSGADRA
jgi:uncharacterized membrane protein